jgi:hypothetical protein
MLRRAAAETDANAALFDAAHGFAGCVAGVHECSGVRVAGWHVVFESAGTTLSRPDARVGSSTGTTRNCTTTFSL